MSAPPAPASNVQEWTVTGLASALRRTVEDAYGRVRLRGEVSNYRGPHSSGHCYFALKDEGACIDAVIWRSSFRFLKFKPEDGLEVIATGRISTFPSASKYQIVIDSLEPAGVGALMQLLEERRKKLAAEGMFDAARKRKLPYLPNVIGVVTSPTGAVIRDILHRLSDRFPRHVLVWPVKVQGESCAYEVTAAIRGFNALLEMGRPPRPDLLIVARGGGSFEDLWGFNEEIVVRAVAASKIPIISAIGHETDWTLIDHAADHRAPTPTAAAERAVPVRADLLVAVTSHGARLFACLSRLIDRKRETLRALGRGLPRTADMFALPRQRLDHAGSRLGRALIANTLAHHRAFGQRAARLRPVLISGKLTRAEERVRIAKTRLMRSLGMNAQAQRHRFERQMTRLRPHLIGQTIAKAHERTNAASRRAHQLIGHALSLRERKLDTQAKLLATLGYQSVLERGYALIFDAAGRTIRRAAETQPGEKIGVRMADGKFDAHVDGERAHARAAPRRARKIRTSSGQGTLL